MVETASGVQRQGRSYSGSMAGYMFGSAGVKVAWNSENEAPLCPVTLSIQAFSTRDQVGAVGVKKTDGGVRGQERSCSEGRVG